jgi:ribosomal protein S13
MKDTGNDFVAYLCSKGLDKEVACSISTVFEFTERSQIRYVDKCAIADLKGGFYDGLVLSDDHIDQLDKICQVFRDQRKKDKRTQFSVLLSAHGIDPDRALLIGEAIGVVWTMQMQYVDEKMIKQLEAGVRTNLVLSPDEAATLRAMSKDYTTSQMHDNEFVVHLVWCGMDADVARRMSEVLEATLKIHMHQIDENDMRSLSSFNKLDILKLRAFIKPTKRAGSPLPNCNGYMIRKRCGSVEPTHTGRWYEHASVSPVTPTHTGM